MHICINPSEKHRKICTKLLIFVTSGEEDRIREKDEGKLILLNSVSILVIFFYSEQSFMYSKKYFPKYKTIKKGFLDASPNNLVLLTVMIASADMVTFN